MVLGRLRDSLLERRARPGGIQPRLLRPRGDELRRDDRGHYGRDDPRPDGRVRRAALRRERAANAAAAGTRSTFAYCRDHPSSE